MQATFGADLAHPRTAVWDEVADLAAYPSWLGIVFRVEEDGDGWLVDLGARLGPLKRAKRVRMERVVADRPATVRFEREERDGQDHSPWVLEAQVAEGDEDGHSTLSMRLSYGGSSPLVALLEPALRLEVNRAVPRLRKRLAGR